MDSQVGEYDLKRNSLEIIAFTDRKNGPLISRVSGVLLITY